MTRSDRERNGDVPSRDRKDDSVSSGERHVEQGSNPSVVRGMSEAGRERMRSDESDAESEQMRIDRTREQEAFERGRPYGID